MHIPQEYLERMHKIGERLISIESHNPGLVRMRSNLFTIPMAVSALQAEGFKKGFFKSGKQFVYDCFLSYHKATQILLPYTMLAGGQEAPGHISCWTGIGEYGGWQGAFQLGDFSSGNKMRLVLIINCEPFFDQIADLFDPVKEK